MDLFRECEMKKIICGPGTPAKSTAKPNRFGKKTMMCVWWDQKGIVYYELLKPDETVNGQRYQQQTMNLNHALIEKRSEWDRRHGKVILLHDNAPCHTEKVVKETINAMESMHLLHSLQCIRIDQNERGSIVEWDICKNPYIHTYIH